MTRPHRNNERPDAGVTSFDGSVLPDLTPGSGFAMAAQRLQACEQWIQKQQVELTAVAAPTGFEAARAEWMRSRLSQLGLAVQIDAAGNVIAESPGARPRGPAIAVTAHLDTAFPPGTPIRPFRRDGRLWGPGICDNGAGLAALLALARCWHESVTRAQTSLLFIATVGEEGEGDLRGMRHLFRPSSRLARRIGCTLVLDGPGMAHITTGALPSLRLRVCLRAPGGHSWSDAGHASALHAAIRVGAALLAQVQTAPGELACNIGLLRGGSAVNAIAAEAELKIDLRALDPLRLRPLEQAVRRAVAVGVEQENAAAHSGRVAASLDRIGARPGGELPPDAPLLGLVQHVDALLGIASRTQCASTDANIPIAQGRQALRLGAGGSAGGIHTLDEWYNPTGRVLALQRILCILAALTNAQFSSSAVHASRHAS